jgi:hypothetical protein
MKFHCLAIALFLSLFFLNSVGYGQKVGEKYNLIAVPSQDNVGAGFERVPKLGNQFHALALLLWP